MESRLLLSAYSQRELGLFGVNTTGANPKSTLVADAGGNLYGTTSEGGPGAVGTVFEIAAGSSALTVLASFNGTNGAQPYAGVTLDAAGNLFGTTDKGGAFDDGTVFEVAAGSNAITTIATFNASNGQYPYAGVTFDGSGNLYGTTTLQNGRGVFGEVFEIPRGTNSIVKVASIYSSDGRVAFDASGNLYGTENQGGDYGDGCVFEIASGSTIVTTLASFTATTGDNVKAGVTVDGAGNLYGICNSGGPATPNPAGTVYEIASGTGTITTLAAFNNSQGFSQGDLTLDAAGDLYGTTWNAGSYGDGSVFEIPSGSNTLTTLAYFNGSNGSTPEAGVAVDAAGNVYGTTEQGGAGQTGTVYEVPKGSSTPVVLAAFNPTNAASLYSGVAFDSSGNLYATAQQGGATGGGAVFEIAKGSNIVTTLASFASPSAEPAYTPFVDAAGNVYGSSSAGVFEVAKGSNAVTVLAGFSGFVGMPNSSIIADSSGNLFGTTFNGGSNYKGSVFEIASGTNTLTTLASFDNSLSNRPSSDLTLDPAGNLYGTTNTGGAYGDGTVFELAKGSGHITTLVSFNGTDGKFPLGGVVRDAAGNLYGTTTQGSSLNFGSVFELPSGSSTLTTLAAFNVSTVGAEAKRLSIDPAGNLYGATQGGGSASPGQSADGTVFELANGSSTLTVLTTFHGPNGAFPQWGVTLDASGNIYGTTSNGGPGDPGTVFELTPNPTPAVTLTLTAGSNPSTTNQPLTFTTTVGSGVPDGEAVTLVDTSNNNAAVATGTLAGGSATLTVPAGTFSVGTHNLVADYAGDANFAASQSAPYAQVVQVSPPTLTGAPLINGDNPNGLFNAAGQTTPGQQRSMAEDIVYTFSEPVIINDANAAFTLAVAGPAGGTLPATLYAQAVANSNGTQWAVSLTGMPEGTIGSIANGEYSITINPAYVLAAADGVTSMAPGTGRTDNFYRLYGDVFGTESVSNADYNLFKKSINTYNPAFDDFGTGTTSSNADYNVFKKDLNISYYGDGFVTTI